MANQKSSEQKSFAKWAACKNKQRQFTLSFTDLFGA